MEVKVNRSAFTTDHVRDPGFNLVFEANFVVNFTWTSPSHAPSPPGLPCWKTNLSYASYNLFLLKYIAAPHHNFEAMYVFLFNKRFSVQVHSTKNVNFPSLVELHVENGLSKAGTCWFKLKLINIAYRLSVT